MNKLIDIDKGLKQTYVDLVMNELNSDKNKSSVSAIRVVCSNCGWGGTLRKVIINGGKKYLCPRCYKKFLEENKMNSKQALLEIYLEAQSNQFHFSNEELVERVNKINNDLEILEILKKYLKNKSLDLGIEDIIICCENEEDYNKIKEWLDNERK